MVAGTPSRHLVSLDRYCTPYNWIVFEAVRYDYLKTLFNHSLCYNMLVFSKWANPGLFLIIFVLFSLQFR